MISQDQVSNCFIHIKMTNLNSTNVWLIWIKEPDQEIWGGGVIFKVRLTQDSFGAKIWLKNKG